MRLLLFMLGIGVGVLCIEKPAEAQNYPWCAIYGEGAVGGGTNCGFITFEQCMETASGLGSLFAIGIRRKEGAVFIMANLGHPNWVLQAVRRGIPLVGA